MSPVKIKIPVATADMRRHSDTLRGAKRRRKRGLRGENRISGANSVVFPSFSERGLTGENARANAVSRRALSPVLPKVGANGGENARASVLRSEGVCSPVYCCHAILITLTDISSPVAADSLHLLIIAPARAAAVLDSPVGGRLGLGSVGVMPSLVMTM